MSAQRMAVTWTGDAIEIVDQTLLPRREEILTLRTPLEVIAAIDRLAVRGAPAIGACGALGVVLVLDTAGPQGLLDGAAAIRAARPTAVNLAWAVDRVLAAADGVEPAALREAIEAEALAILAEERAASAAIGEHGRLELAGATRLLTICNTGRLATTGQGTALGVAYAKAAAGERVEVFACETRPLLQGARLTAWELGQAGIPVTVLVDSAAASLMAAGRVDAVIVGCDRVAANGDTANKVGTYALAVAAARHGVPFYVAGPRSTLDLATPTGAHIVVEERDGDEVRAASGLGPEVAVWNPAFDVTPAALITGLITEVGVLRAPLADAIAQALLPREVLAA